YGDLAEPWDLTVDEPFVNDEGRLFVGDIRVLDSRASVVDVAPDIIEQTRILRVSAPIPNDTMSFGPDFPAELRTQIYEALVAFSETDAWEQSALGNSDGYS